MLQAYCQNFIDSLKKVSSNLSSGESHCVHITHEKQIPAGLNVLILKIYKVNVLEENTDVIITLKYEGVLSNTLKGKGQMKQWKTFSAFQNLGCHSYEEQIINGRHKFVKKSTGHKKNMGFIAIKYKEFLQSTKNIHVNKIHRSADKHEHHIFYSRNGQNNNVLFYASLR